MNVRKLLHQVYNEISCIEELRKERATLIEDTAGGKAIQIEVEKVCGGRQSDLSEVLERIEDRAVRIDAVIGIRLERVMKLREEAYRILERIPESPGKMAAQEHYLYHVPWEELSGRKYYATGYLKRASGECITELQKICDAEM
jgi:hypothetical protein